MTPAQVPVSNVVASIARGNSEEVTTPASIPMPATSMHPPVNPMPQGRKVKPFWMHSDIPASAMSPPLKSNPTATEAGIAGWLPPEVTTNVMSSKNAPRQTAAVRGIARRKRLPDGDRRITVRRPRDFGSGVATGH